MSWRPRPAYLRMSAFVTQHNLHPVRDLGTDRLLPD